MLKGLIQSLIANLTLHRSNEASTQAMVRSQNEAGSMWDWQVKQIRTEFVQE